MPWSRRASKPTIPVLTNSSALWAFFVSGEDFAKETLFWKGGLCFFSFGEIFVLMANLFCRWAAFRVVLILFFDKIFFMVRVISYIWIILSQNCDRMGSN